MRCCIVRHGETPWNADRRLQGHQDIPLNALGLAQAEAAGQYLQRRHQATPFSAVVSSDLLRARQTAEAVADALGLSVQAEPALRERHYGQFEGKTPAEAEIFQAEAYAALVSRADLMAAPGSAEPLQAMLERIEHCLFDLARVYADQSVVIVTHGGVLDLLYRRAMGRALTGPRDAPIPNAGLNWLDIEAEDQGLRWTMVAWGETEHLTGASRDEIL
ncbi:MAG: histidine phosphatase family protein [Sphingomonadaceae bacterium]|nr:histidine phosphatase family protein [Sphingomonadaceae bacterium]